MTAPFHPDLALARWIPPFSYGPRLARILRGIAPRGARATEDVRIDEIVVSPTVSIRRLRPASDPAHPLPALLWIHGGGHLFGSPEQDDRANLELVRELGLVVLAVRYRLGADAPAPASVDDCSAALHHAAGAPAELSIDPSRIAVGGASAGGGIAAAVVARAHDLGEVHVALQLLVYPMLDDRTVLRDEVPRGLRMWTPRSNRLGWRTYLGAEPGAEGVPAEAAPARRRDLGGLPPAWIGVGTLDLFLDEDATYARRLQEAGVPCDLEVVEGAFHGFDQLFPSSPVVRAFRAAQVDALRRAGMSA